MEAKAIKAEPFLKCLNALKTGKVEAKRRICPRMPVLSLSHSKKKKSLLFFKGIVLSSEVHCFV